MKKLILIALLLIFCSLNSIAEIDPFAIVSPQGKYIAFVQGKKVKVYNTEDSSLAMNHEASVIIIGLGFSNDETKMTFSDDYYTFSSFNLEDENTLLWESDLSDFVDMYEVDRNLMITYSANENQILQIFEEEAVVLDAYSGEFIGYEKLDIQIDKSSSFWFRTHSVIANKDNSFSIVYSNQSEHSIVNLSIEGYGQTSQQSTKYNKILGGINQIKKAEYESRGNNDYTLQVNGDDFMKWNNVNRGELPELTFSTNGESFVAQDQNEINYYKSDNHKPVFNIKQPKEFEATFLDSEKLIVTAPKKLSYKIYNSSDGNLVSTNDKTDDFAYKGSAISLGKGHKEAGVIFYDDFEDNENQWSLKPGDNYTKSIEKGNLIFTYDEEKGTRSLWNNKIEIDQFREFEIETSVKIVGRDKGEFGIFWDRKDDIARYHGFYIRPQGDYGVWEYSGFWIGHLKYVKSPIMKVGEYNKMLVRKSQDTYSFFINDSLVYQMPFEGFHGTKVGFSYPADVTTQIDYLKISYLSVNTSTEAVVFNDQFDDNRFKWASGLKAGVYNQSVENGYYRYENMANQTYSKWSERIFLDNDKEWELETSLKFESSNSNHALALVWGRSDTDGKKYQFGISKLGSFVIHEYNGTKWTTLKPWTSHNAIKKTDFNKLKIHKKKNVYKFYINGSLVEVLKAPSGGSYSFGPRVGFDIPGETVAHIDYIKARYIKTANAKLTGCKYYVPYMQVGAKGNDTGRFLIGGITQCNAYLRMYKGHSKDITYRQQVHYRTERYDTREEAALGRQSLIDMFGNSGYANWNHSLQCMDGCN